MDFESIKSLQDSLGNKLGVLKLDNGDDVPFDANDELSIIHGNDMLISSEEHMTKIVDLDHVAVVTTLDFEKINKDIDDMKKELFKKVFNE
ncbi:hypothetical protein [uncultured Methanobrevibacter sp.]|uniref:hypothetical protein n=1 Tax=uncultured Methanobrevibacter sp. TaxID=253161 RepID=UPI0025F49D36|nr:hypothetical protein [uncultured Methanobrevibacter sp.]